MSAYGSESSVSAEEVRAWYQSRGIPVSSRIISKAHVDGWNRAHPDRPYAVGSMKHGTWNAYNNHGCRCRTCKDGAVSAQKNYGGVA